MRRIEIEQTHSPIRRHQKQRATLIGLGLNRIGRVCWVVDNPAVRGMIGKVRHLIRINHDPRAPASTTEVAVPDEASDVQLMRDLIFDGNGVALEAYDDAELKQGKTPDFKLRKNGALCGFCELKSPRDDFILAAPEPGRMAVRKNLPYYRKLGSFVKNAVKQFDAVNADRERPNILVFVSHSPEIERRDLIATIVGLPVPGGKSIYLLGRKMQHQVMAAARKVDLFLWIDASARTCQHLTDPNAKHRTTALQLLGLPLE